MGFSLYDLDSAVYTVLENGLIFDEETGEILFNEGNLDALEMLRNEKLEAVALYVKSLRAEVEAFKAEQKTLADRRAIIERKAERLTDYLARSMAAFGDTKLTTPRVALSWRKSEAVEIDESKLPRDFYKATYAPNKTAIKAAIKAGEEVEGAQIVERQNLLIK